MRLDASALELLPPDERPRERLNRAGAPALSLRECLAVLIGNGHARRDALGIADDLVARFCGSADLETEGPSASDRELAFFLSLERELAHTTPIAGLPSGLESRLRSAFELARRYRRATRAPAIREPASSRSALKARARARVPVELRDSPTEWMGYVPVMRGTACGAFSLIARGSRSRVSIEPADLFAPLLALRPRGFYLFHNHPSGDPTPSSEDLRLTDKVFTLARDLRVPLLGHAVVTAQVDDRWIYEDFLAGEA